MLSARKAAGVMSALVLTAAMGFAQATVREEHVTLENFDSRATGSVASLSAGSFTILGRSLAIEGTGANHYATADGGIAIRRRGDMELGGFDIAVTAPADIDGTPALSYMVYLTADIKFPLARQILLPAPGDNGLSFIHVDRQDFGADLGDPYGYWGVENIGISVWACKVAGCDDLPKNQVYRAASGPPSASGYDAYVTTTFAIDNVQMIALSVPEPSSYAMLLAGLTCLAGLKRRRQRQLNRR